MRNCTQMIFCCFHNLRGKQITSTASIPQLLFRRTCHYSLSREAELFSLSKKQKQRTLSCRRHSWTLRNGSFDGLSEGPGVIHPVVIYSVSFQHCCLALASNGRNGKTETPQEIQLWENIALFDIWQKRTRDKHNEDGKRRTSKQKRTCK